jgi:hypothetical protein
MKVKFSLGFFSILTLIFVVAKLAGAIDWSWWLVFLPMLIPIGIACVIYGAFIIGSFFLLFLAFLFGR